MKWLQLIIAEVLLGYLLQCGACMVGICAVAKKRIRWLPLILSSVVFAIAIYFVRQQLGNRINFGVHTMIMLLVINVICVFILRIDIRSSIIGSLLVTAIVLAGELVNVGLLMLIYKDTAVINERMLEQVFKAWAAVPGNILLLVIVIIAYLKRSVKGTA